MAHTLGFGVISLLDTCNLRERVYETRDKMKIFEAVCDTLILMNAKMSETEVRFRRAKANDNRIFQEVLNQKLTVLKSMRYLVYRVADKIATETDLLVENFQRDFGINWFDIARDRDFDDF